MTSNLYIPRRLYSGNDTYDEASLLTASNHIVVLAEPGAGKTELLQNLAKRLNTKAVSAKLFSFTRTQSANSPLVIDAFDELAKIDVAGVERLLGKAQALQPTSIVISSRSSEWGNSATQSFAEFFGHQPLIARLEDFNEGEQKAIFENHLPSEDFEAFRGEVSRFDLHPVLHNPEFLKLFADAYIQSNRAFSDKRSIFEQAIERLAREANNSVSRHGILPLEKKISLASEIFAKLLFAGCEGVCTNEANESRVFPFLPSLSENNGSIEAILTTRLFKPGDIEDQHKPTHKIVTEYCAASYITKRIADDADPLSLAKCFALIAPNSTVRDELRGLLGWMASLGTNLIQEAAIEIDAYAVLANGDPSQLSQSSKRKLIHRLVELEKIDPYFRRGDFWRRFSAAGFFTVDIVNEIRPLLMGGSGQGHLHGLLLELLAGSSVIPDITSELQSLSLDVGADKNTRVLASERLVEVDDYDHQGGVATLIAEASETSLNVVANIVKNLGASNFSEIQILEFMRACSNLYPNSKSPREITVGARWFVKSFSQCLNFELVEYLLDELTSDLSCMCGKDYYQCECRNGISKVVGILLDRYFDLPAAVHDPGRLWGWLRKLNFHQDISADQSASVQFLQNNENLRREIALHAFSSETAPEKVRELVRNQFGFRPCHSGLRLQNKDRVFIINWAFEQENIILWSQYIAHHQRYIAKSDRGPDPMRKLMREQALAKPEFMKAWAKVRRQVMLRDREDRLRMMPHGRSMRRFHRREKISRDKGREYFESNRDQILEGRHWGYLSYFANLVLSSPSQVPAEFEDRSLARNALYKCLSFIEKEVPSLAELAKLQCASQSHHSERVLYAACLEILNRDGTLESVSHDLLRALRTNLDMHYQAVTQEQRVALAAEVERLIFPGIDEAEVFCRNYIEPQLVNPNCKYTEVGWLQSESAFQQLRKSLPLEWVNNYESMPADALEKLFEMVVEHESAAVVEKLVEKRCNELGEGPKEQRDFWSLRALYFTSGNSSLYIDWLQSDKDIIFHLERRSGPFGRSDYRNWPTLNAEKIELILDAYIDHWPEVPLPSSHGTSSPRGEVAYRFLSGLVWTLGSDNPDRALPVIDRLLVDKGLDDFHNALRSVKTAQTRARGLATFQPPSPSQVVRMLDHCEVVSVEGLRALLIEELEIYQKDLKGSETTSRDIFYKDYAEGVRIGEVDATLRVADRLRLCLEPKGITITPEHQLADANRSDFTCTKLLNNERKLLVTEVKGQWHRELYTAASAQLHDRYSIHPNAESQGVYLVIWFGADELVAGKKKHSIRSAQELKESIEFDMPDQLSGLIDVFVIDVAKPG